jgi:hypothetical protein
VRTGAFIQAEPRIDKPALKEAEQNSRLKEAQNGDDEE